jgi:hypothetical protein
MNTLPKLKYIKTILTNICFIQMTKSNEPGKQLTPEREAPGQPMSVQLQLYNTRWFKYDWDYLDIQISPGHI